MGMKLKSGADLCGFELSRFCVQNDVAIPDAPASGRKYFHTGTGMEGKYSLLGRERIYTGTAWRSAAYVDDLANLDITSNADYLALKEKVELLSGEVDTDAIINNMKEVTAFLSGFAEDANLMSVLNNKLDKSNGAYYGLDFNSTGENGMTRMVLRNNGNVLVEIGHTGSVAYFSNYLTSADIQIGDTITVKERASNNRYDIIHSGNIGEYKAGGLAKPVTIWGQSFDGTGDVSGHLILNNQSAIFSYTTSGTSLELFNISSNNNLYIGYSMAGVGGSYIYGNEIYLRYGSSRTNGLILNSSGNVGIGIPSPEYKLHVIGNTFISGFTIAAKFFTKENYGLWRGNSYSTLLADTDVVYNATKHVLAGGNVGIGLNAPQAKLHVAEDIVANGTIACKGVAAEGSAPVGTVDKWAGSIAIGTKSQPYTHGLGTTDITVAIYEKNGNEWVQILTDVDIVNANTIRVTFGANTTVEHRIVVMG